MTQEDFSAVCPYLGLADDADSHATYATEAHRCYRLPNPTRIASPHQESYCLGSNHVTCPVYLGEGVPKPAPAAAAGAFTAGAPSRPQDGGETVRGPQSGQRPAARRPFEPGPGAAAGGAARGAKRPQKPGALGPRPRAGGVSMPVATIGLFALAVIVIGLAFAINNLVGGGSDDPKISSADVVATRASEKATQTAKAGGGVATQVPQTQPAGSQTPGTATATLAPGQTRTTTVVAGSTTPGSTAKTYTVKSGDTCGAIAIANNITLQQLLTANNKSEDDCTKLQVGDVLKLP
ncbi:MAG: LysM peptidoglycan-binding domain-containing protein [Anaerolineaceae bacterium]